MSEAQQTALTPSSTAQPTTGVKELQTALSEALIHGRVYRPAPVEAQPEGKWSSYMKEHGKEEYELDAKAQPQQPESARDLVSHLCNCGLPMSSEAWERYAFFKIEAFATSRVKAERERADHWEANYKEQAALRDHYHQLGVAAIKRAEKAEAENVALREALRNALHQFIDWGEKSSTIIDAMEAALTPQSTEPKE